MFVFMTCNNKQDQQYITINSKNLNLKKYHNLKHDWTITMVLKKI